MTELTTSQLIKIILGTLVVAAVVLGTYFFFKEYVIDFFKNIPSGIIIPLINFKNGF